MGTWTRKLLWAGAFWACAGASTLRAEDPISAAAKATFNSIGRGKEADEKGKPADKSIDQTIQTVAGKDCAEGACPAKADCEPAVDNRASKPGLINMWLSSKSMPCECKKHPTPYRPPLYTWFPCKQSVNWRNGCALPNDQPVVVAAMPVEQPVRMPNPPSHLLKETPLVPGSSTALANNKDGLKMPPPPLKKNAPAWLASDPKTATTKR